MEAPKKRKNNENDVSCNLGPSSYWPELYNETDETNSAPFSSTNRRKKVSRVWEDFEEVINDGKIFAKCKHCNKLLAGSSKSGTTHLRNHLSHCRAKEKGEAHKKLITCSKKDKSADSRVGKNDSEFNQEKSWMDLTIMAIKHWHALDIVEDESFGNLLKNLQPNFRPCPRGILNENILSVYNKEKDNLRKHLSMLSCNFSVIIKVWTCYRKKSSYCCLRLQYAEEGKLKNKMLAFKSLEFKNEAASLFEIVQNLLREWNIDRKLYSITLECSESNCWMIKQLQVWLDFRVHNLGKKLYHICCTTHDISLLAQDGLRGICDILHKIRKTIDYINQKTEFEDILKEVNLQGEEIASLDVPTKWEHSTFHMLGSALKLKKALGILGHRLKISDEEWNMAQIVYNGLKAFNDAVCSFSGSKHVTANEYFYKVCTINRILINWRESGNTDLLSLANSMKKKFEKRLGKGQTDVMAIATMLDPRRKQEFMQFALKNLYGDNADQHLNRILNALVGAYDDYANELGIEVTSPIIDNGNCSTSYNHDGDDMLDMWYRSKNVPNNVTTQRAEIDKYFEEPTLPDPKWEIDILGWWRDNTSNFPILGKMAPDILTIPMSILESDFAFCTETINRDSAIDGNDPKIIEALICGKDWLDRPESYASNKGDEHSSCDSLGREPAHTPLDLARPSLSSKPQEILGTGMSAKMWEVTVEHPRTCAPDKRVMLMFLYIPPSSQRKNGVVFNIVGQVKGLLLECQFVPVDKLSETEKVDAHNWMISAFQHWEEVSVYGEEASLACGSSHVTNVDYAESSSRAHTSIKSHRLKFDSPSDLYSFMKSSARAQERWRKLFNVLKLLWILRKAVNSKKIILSLLSPPLSPLGWWMAE